MHDIHSKYSENETVAVQFQSAGTIETKSLKVEQEMRDIKSENVLFFNVFPFFLFKCITLINQVLYTVVFLAAYFDFYPVPVGLLSLKFTVVKCFKFMIILIYTIFMRPEHGCSFLTIRYTSQQNLSSLHI